MTTYGRLPLISNSIFIELAELDKRKMQSASSMIKGLIETELYHLNFKEPKDHPTRKSSGRNKPHRIELQSAYYGRIIFRYLKIEHYQLTMPGNTSSEIHGDWRYDEFLLKL